MKKRILTLATLTLAVLSLSSCKLLGSNLDTEYGLDDDTPTTEVVTTYVETYNKISPSCVGIRNTVSNTGYKIGSGVIIKSDSTYTYVLTNRHVVELTDETQISSNVSVYFGNSQYVSGKVIAQTTYAERTSNYSTDLAIVRIKTPSGKSYTPVEMGDDIVTKGQTVLAVGCPVSLDYYNTLTVGVVEKYLSGNMLIMHQATINPGNSGGGLFSATGRLIGINVSRQESSTEVIEDMCYAIDMNQIRNFLSENDFEL